jgi:hypothetical protein
MAKFVDFDEIFGKAFSCGWSLKRIVPFFLVYVVVLAGLLAFLELA